MKRVAQEQKAFTIVELLIVIVVIAILAAITIVAYNGIQRSAVASSMKATLQNTAKKFKTDYLETDIYPTSLGNISVPANMGMALSEVSAPNEFCINITHQTIADLQWHMTQTLVLETGLCSGAIIASSIVGSFNSSASPPLTSVVTVNGDQGGFSATTADNWSTVTLNWATVSGASRYEIQISTDNGATWNLRRILDDDSRPNGAVATYQSDVAFSAQLPNTQTSLVWHGPNAVPQSTSLIYQYRFRSYNGSTPSAWSTAVLPAPTVATTVGSVTNLAAAPSSDWSEVGISWTSPQTNVPSPYVEIQLRNVADGTWYLRRILDSSANANAPIASYETDPAFSARIPLSTQSLTWHGVNAVPQANGAIYEYRARIRSAAISGLIRDWSPTVQVSMPTYSALTNFTAVAAGSGTSSTLTMNWTSPSGAVPPTKVYEIQLRNMADGVWYLRRIADTSSNPNAAVASYETDSAFSARIPSATTSLVWDGVNPTPQTGQTFEYRIRQKSSTLSGVYSDWYTIQVAR